MEYSLPVSFCLNLTNQCCLKCKYCFVQQTPLNMSYEIGVKAINKLIENLKIWEQIYNQKKEGFLWFFGGEPILQWNLIQQLVFYIQSQQIPFHIHLGITTNGVLLSKEKIDYLYNNNIIPLLSIDGDEKTQNLNRPYHNGKGSFNDLINNIPYLLKKFPNTVFRATLHEPTVQYLFENFLFAEEVGFKKIFICPNSRKDFNNEIKIILYNELQKIFQYMTNKICLGEEIISCNIVEDGFKKAIQIQSKDNTADYKNFFRCGLGSVGVGVSPTGDLYACQEWSSTSQDSIFYLGNLDSGIDKEKQNKLIELYNSDLYIENPEMCKNCVLQGHCIDIDCPSSSWFLLQKLKGKTKSQCWWDNTIVSMASKIQQNFIGNKQNCLNFMNYLKNLIEEGENIDNC